MTETVKNNKPAYSIFKKNSRMALYGELLDDACASDVVFFGEFHDNPVCHWLELELAIDLYGRKGSRLILGGEMFDTDNATIIEEYLSGYISESYFESQCRLWPNYYTDYKPLIEFAGNHKIPFIATNIPRRYAGIVLEKGFEGLTNLSRQARECFPPLPLKYDPELPCYRNIRELFDEEGVHPAGEYLPMAQAVKDATMAWAIIRNWESGRIFLHFNGTYHTDNFEGIAWYLKHGNPGLKILTISSVIADDPENPDCIDPVSADYILCIPRRMTRTY
jgi:uncharacterized iron-regulated protein